jgi:hypothetical protein
LVHRAALRRRHVLLQSARLPPVAYRVNSSTGREEINANGAWYPVEYDKVLPFSSPDGGSHACWAEAVQRPVFRCIILPGMAFIAPSTALA